MLLVKLADRLHNMRTLHFIKSAAKRERIARETLDIYAPLARSIGCHRICIELEELAFSHLNPVARDAILRRLDTLPGPARATLVAQVSAEDFTQAGTGGRARPASSAARSTPTRSGASCSASRSASRSSPTSSPSG